MCVFVHCVEMDVLYASGTCLTTVHLKNAFTSMQIVALYCTAYSKDCTCKIMANAVYV